MRQVLLLPSPLLMFLAVATAIMATMPDPNCREKCGNITIPYPFGVGDGCFRPGFSISCKPDPLRAGMYMAIIGENIRVINISLVPAQVRVYTYIAFACHDHESGNILSEHSEDAYTDVRGTPYRFSDTSNKFTAVGCRTVAYIRDPYAQSRDPRAPMHYYMSGCVSICQDKYSVTDGAPCTGTGCCHASIPKGLQFFNATFDDFTDSYVGAFNPCSYAFLADQDWYVFNASDLHINELTNRNEKGAPVVLDWAIRDEACEQAKLNTTAYACAAEFSECVDSTNGPGYTCNCTSGFEGNPYALDGCKGFSLSIS